MFEAKPSPFTTAVSDIRKLKLEEVRTDAADYFEFVIQTSFLDDLNFILSRYFGDPVKPAGKGISGDMNKYVAAYGGIRKEQTLYHVENDGFSNCVMIWPWSNGILLTVKMARKSKAGL